MLWPETAPVAYEFVSPPPPMENWPNIPPAWSPVAVTLPVATRLVSVAPMSTWPAMPPTKPTPLTAVLESELVNDVPLM